MDTARQLEQETLKWMKKLEAELRSLQEPPAPQARDEMKNVRAYLSDCKHFLEKKDFLRAFEAIVYAWAIWDVLHRCELIKDATPDK
jgi:hypothetical protein